MKVHDPMRKLRTICMTLGALTGLGGAYASTSREVSGVAINHLTYNWYTPAGTPFSTGMTINGAINASGCYSGIQTCLRGTNFAKQQQPVTLFFPR